MRYLVLFLLLFATGRAGIVGLPRSYVIADATDVDRTFISTTVQKIAGEYGLKGRLGWSSDLRTFVYYTSNAGTLQARKDKQRVIVNATFLAREQKLALAIHAALLAALGDHFGDRFSSCGSGEQPPNHSPEPPPSAAH